MGKPVTQRALALRAHARQRAAERYGLSYNRAMLGVIREEIRNGRSPVLQRASIRVTLRMVTVEGITVPIVWDRERREVVTFLPPDARQLSVLAATEATR